MKRLIVIALLALILVSVGCATSTLPSRTYLKKSEINKISKVGLAIVTKPEFSVIYSRDSGSNPGVFFGLLGAAIVEGLRESEDISKKKELQELHKMGKSDFEQILIEIFVKEIKLTKTFNIIPYHEMKEELREEDFKEYRDKGIEGVIHFSIEEIGLKRGQKDLLHGFIYVTGKLYNVVDGRLIWNQEESQMDSKGYTFDMYKNQKGLLKKVIERTIKNVAIRLAQDIIYAK